MTIQGDGLCHCEEDRLNDETILWSLHARPPRYFHCILYFDMMMMMLMKPSFGVFMHDPPVHIEDCDSLELENPAFRIEATLGGHFVILQVAILPLTMLSVST